MTNKYDIDYIESASDPVMERKQTAATCAPNKEKTYDLIKIHESKIKKALYKDGDVISNIKVIKKGINTLSQFQTMISKSVEPKEESTPMIVLR